jgi:hypothetical protein
MRRRLSLVTLSACAALAGTRGSAREPRQQERHVVASPNPTIDDGKPPAARPGEVSGTKVRPATTTTAAPMKKAARPKRKYRSSQ